MFYLKGCYLTNLYLNIAVLYFVCVYFVPFVLPCIFKKQIRRNSVLVLLSRLLTAYFFTLT